MPEPIEKQLIDLFATAWSDAAPGLVGTASALNLVAQREASGPADVQAALESASAYPCAFVADCSGALTGLLLCLLKKEDRRQIELLIGKTTGNKGADGMLSLINATFTTTAAILPEQTTFGTAVYADLTSKEAGMVPAPLLAVAGESIWVNTVTLTIGERLDSQLLVLYAPHGSVEALLAEPTASAEPIAQLEQAEPPVPVTAAASAGAVSGFTTTRRMPRAEASRNMERLLEVELEVVVRFGVTQMPLRELIRIGVGSMIELNRQVDEPVELLVNNHPLARGTVVVVDGYYGVCITEIGQPEERRQSLMQE